MKNTQTNNYGYYSRVLSEPFDSLDELMEAEEAYYAKLKAKEDKAAQKKADAQRVEDAFKDLNAARKVYKENIITLTEDYRESLNELKTSFEEAKAEVQEELASYEDAYSTALKEFTEKYPEGFHLTLKDGDFETTIDSKANTSAPSTLDIFNLLFGF
jgi:chromosome segregation ATPase